MGEQRNLTEENVNLLGERLEDMQKENPDLEFDFFQQRKKETLEDPKPEWKSCDTELIEKLLGKVEALERRFDIIFGNHVLVKGQFQDITQSGRKVGK